MGAGTLSIANLAIVDGYYHTAGNAFGGCILQPPTGGGLYLQNVSVSGCIVSSDTADAHGGGIDAAGAVFLMASTISGNKAEAPQGKACGGGLEATQAATLYSSITANTGIGLDSAAGGAYVRYAATFFGTIIDQNAAAVAGGLLVGRVQGATAMIVNSTISSNISETSSAAIYADAASFKLWNSTVAFNHTNLPSTDAAVLLIGPPSATFDLTSSIIANNLSGPTNDEADLYFVTGSGTITGSHDLIMASNVAPPNMIVSTADPELGPLQNNGGLTRSHMPASDSPALAMGINNGLIYEQRGPGYPRSTGNSTDIGAVQFDSIFKDNFD
jgi:hypothetical protein